MLRGISEEDLVFLKKFFDKIKVNAETDCWEWQGSTNSGGYGNGFEKLGAHVWSYKFFVGPVPKGLQVCHSCHNTICVNPLHLSINTDPGNKAQSKGKIGRKKGEPFRKLTEEQVIEMRRRYREEDINMVKLAKDYPEVTYRQVKHIINRICWKHI